MTSHPLTREYFQSAFVVENLEAACHQWSNNFGIGPFLSKIINPELLMKSPTEERLPTSRCG